MANSFPKAGRAAVSGMSLTFGGVGNLAIASTVTLGLIIGMVLTLIFGITLIMESANPALGLGIAIAGTLVFNLIFFLISPWLMDLSQKWLYQTKWITIADLAKRSPESAQVIRQICEKYEIKQPRLGLIDDQNPTAFTYGTFRNDSRLVVSAGLFTYLDDDEAATVYAHELGHIVHWDFAVMTLAATMVQIMYLIYIFARRVSNSGGDNKAKDAIAVASLIAYIFYVIGTYMLLYLSRTREYFADKFAAESTGNPNALSRALVKIAYGIVEEGERTGEPSKLAEGTRALGIYDAKAAVSTGTAYRVAANPEQVGRVFLWDLFNPWGWWMELNSTHPLTGKRVRALGNYAEQMDLAVEFDMANVAAEGRKLSKQRLYQGFLFDVVLYSVELIGIIAGLVVGAILAGSTKQIFLGYSLGGAFIGYGIGVIIKTLVSFPNYDRVENTNVLALMSDPYASPLRGKPVKLDGELIGRGDAGAKFGSDLKLKDKTGMIYLHYASRFGPIGNFLFGMKRVQSLIGVSVQTVGWFRRGVAPWVDLIQLKSDSGTVVNSYHRFWAFMISAVAIMAGIAITLTFRT